MRSSFILLAVLFCFSCNSSKTIRLDDKKEVSEGITARWESTYLETRASRVKVPEGQIMTVEYKPDGTYSASLKGGSIVNTGTWNYDAATRMLQTVRGGNKADSRIVSITGSELVVVEYTIMSDGTGSEITDSTVATFRKL